MTLLSRYHDLIGAPHYAHVVTVNGDGSPKSTVVWVERDDDDVLFVTGARSRKAHNLARDPRIAVSIHDAANPYRAVELRGRAEIEPADGYEMLDRLANAYLGLEESPYGRSGEAGIRVRVRVERAVAHGGVDQPPSQPIDARADLLGPPHFGHVATVSPDGRPCTSPLWITSDGDDVSFWTQARGRKIRNLEINPAIAISVHDEANPLRYVEVRGTAELQPVPHAKLLDELARRYWQVDEYPNKEPGMSGVEVRVHVDHRTGFDGR